MFFHEGNDQFRFIGGMQVTDVNEEDQPDSKNVIRKAYVFTLQRVTTVPECNIVPRVDNERVILMELGSLQSELIQISHKQERYKRNRKLV